MTLLLISPLDFSFPLKNPVLIFSLILFIILFAPIILNKLRIPHLIGLIIAGAVIGPNGLNMMLRDSSIELFGTVGLLYIMFLAGLEIDMAEFKKNSGKSVVFGLYTFSIPMTLGTLIGYYFLEYSLPTSVLLASMFASHTLLAYPLVSKLGVAKNRAVNITVGGTVITDTLALLVLAAIVGMSTGETDKEFWIRLSLQVIAFGAAIVIFFPIIGRWFFKKYEDSISHYIFVLAMVFLGAFMAEAAGIEGIIGAFLAGLALNRLIPHTSALMNRIEFVGNALFIPFFLIGVGMLINYKAFFMGFETIKVAVTMTIVATTSKFLAAYVTQKTFKFSIDERRLIFGLSNAQAAATLAAVLVGYKIITGETESGEPIRLLSESILNGTILMILATCTIASFIAQRGAQNIAINETPDANEDEVEVDERILIPIANIDNASELINLSVTIKSDKNKKGLFALNVINTTNSDASVEKKAKEILSKAAVMASATDNTLQELLRYDVNITNGILNVVKENKITDLVLGLHDKSGISDSFLGNLTEGILKRCQASVFIYKPGQPLATVKRHIIVIPERAEKEVGFPLWLSKVWNIGKNTGAKLIFYAYPNTLKYLNAIQEKYPIDAKFIEFTDWNDFLILSREMEKNDNLIIILSRKERLSYHLTMQKIPTYLNKYFNENNFLLIYPMQFGIGESDNIDFKNLSIHEPLGQLDDLGQSIANLFKKKK